MNIHELLTNFHNTGNEDFKEEVSHLDEAGLSHLINYMMKYDTGTMTASRKENSRKENLQRNAKLLAILQNKRYNVISVRGGTIENYGKPNETPVHENTFFVIDKTGNNSLLQDLLGLGEEFGQDGIMFIPKGGTYSELWGTSHENDYPEYGQKETFNNLKIGKKNVVDSQGNPIEGYNRPDPEYFTSKSGRPFFFEAILKEHTLRQGYFGRLGVYGASKAPIEEQSPTLLDNLKMSHMEYIGLTKFPEAGKENGYWAKGSKVYNVSGNHHIAFIIDHPDLFDLTPEDIKSVFDKHGEQMGREGKAREELIISVSSQGWIRVRHYYKPEDYWSIQCDSTRSRKDEIKSFIWWAIENKIMGYHDPAILLGYNNSNDKEVYSFQRGGIENFLMEEKLHLKKKYST